MGAGNISSAYLRLAPLFKGLEVRGVADIIPAAAKTRGEEFGVHAMTPGRAAQELRDRRDREPDDPGDALPGVDGRDLGRQACLFRKAVRAEPQGGQGAEEGGGLARAARRFGAGHISGRAHQQVRNIIDSKQLGKITHGTTHVMSRGMEHWHPNPDFFFQVGAGPVLDIGPYYVTGPDPAARPVRRVTSFTNSAKTHRVVTTPGSPMNGKKIKVGTPTTIHGILEFESGRSSPSRELGYVQPRSPQYRTLRHRRLGLCTRSELLRRRHSDLRPVGDQAEGRAVGPSVRQGQPGARYGDATRQLPHGRARRHDPGDRKEPSARCGLDVALHAVDVMTSLLKAGETGKVLTLSTTCERPKALTPKDAQALLK